jgi:chromosomal replication initiation ATPase DnaA
MKQNTYHLPVRINDNERHAEAIRLYWAQRGVHVSVLVCELTGEIKSSLDAESLPDVVDTHTFNEKYDRAEQAVAKERRIPVADLVSRSRSWPTARARHELWRRLHVDEGISKTTIARHYGVDHSSVVHGVRRAEARL